MVDRLKPGYREFMEEPEVPPPPVPTPPPPEPRPVPPPPEPAPPPLEPVVLEFPEAVVQELKRVNEGALRDLLADPEKTLALLNGWSPADCQDTIIVYQDTIAPGASSTLTSSMPAGFVALPLHIQWKVEQEYILSLTLHRDTYLMHSDAALVEGWTHFPFWLPATNRLAFALTNNDAVFTTRVHCQIQAFYVRAELWQRISRLILDHGGRLAALGGG